MCIATFKNGNFKDIFIWHHAPVAEYWPMWTRQLGSMIQLIPILLIPLVAVIQSYRYLNNGPSDILDVSRINEIIWKLIFLISYLYAEEDKIEATLKVGNSLKSLKSIEFVKTRYYQLFVGFFHTKYFFWNGF